MRWVRPGGPPALLRAEDRPPGGVAVRGVRPQQGRSQGEPCSSKSGRPLTRACCSWLASMGTRTRLVQGCLCLLTCPPACMHCQGCWVTLWSGAVCMLWRSYNASSSVHPEEHWAAFLQVLRAQPMGCPGRAP